MTRQFKPTFVFEVLCKITHFVINEQTWCSISLAKAFLVALIICKETAQATLSNLPTHADIHGFERAENVHASNRFTALIR